MNKKKYIYILISALLVVAIVIGIGIVYAKYVYNKKIEAELTYKNVSQNEYLKIADDNGYPLYIIYDTKVSFDVAPTYTVSADMEGVLSGADGSYTVRANYGDKVKVEATMVTVGSAKKTLGAVFAFVETPISTTYTIKDVDGEYFIVLDIYTGTIPPSQITVIYGEGLIPDNSNPLMSDWKSVNTDTFKSLIDLDSDSHYQLIFFDETDTDHSKASTTLSGGIVTIDLT